MLSSRLTSGTSRLRAALVVGTVLTLVLGGAAPGHSAPERAFELTTPTPARGYWLPGDPTLDFDVACLDGERYSSPWNDEVGSSGWSGGGGFGQSISSWAGPGTYDFVLVCRSADGEVMDTKTISIEIGAATELVATVGTVDGECADASEITVAPGTEVFWCYTLRLNPEIADPDLFGMFDEVLHHIVDDLSGDLGGVSIVDHDLIVDGLSSSSLGLRSSSVVTADTVNTGVWSTTVTDDEGETFIDLPVVSASARVRVSEDGNSVDDPSGPAPTTAPNAGPGSSLATAPGATPVPAAPTYTG